MVKINLSYDLSFTFHFERKTCFSPKMCFGLLTIQKKSHICEMKCNLSHKDRSLSRKLRFSYLENLEKNHYKKERIDPCVWRIDPCFWRIDPWRSILPRFFFFQGSLFVEWKINPCDSSSKILLYLHLRIDPWRSKDQPLFLNFQSWQFKRPFPILYSYLVPMEVFFETWVSGGLGQHFHYTSDSSFELNGFLFIINLDKIRCLHIVEIDSIEKHYILTNKCKMID